MIDNNKVMETPFSLPLEDVDFIKQQAEYWKNTSDRSEKIKISKSIAAKYGKDSKQYEFFEVAKSRKESVSKREKPKYKRTQKDLNECQILISGAVQLMYDRLMGKTDFDISERQYSQFLTDAREETKLFTWGFITLDEVAEWVFDSINVELEE